MNPESTIKVMLADDQALIRQGLKYIIDAQTDMAVVGEAADGEQAIDLAMRTDPDVVLMDIQMPKCTGIEATGRIVRALTSVKVVLLTTFDVQEYVYDGIRSGAVGYMLKDSDADELLGAIRSAFQGQAVYRTKSASQAILQAVSPPTQVDTYQLVELLEPLTDREIDVLQQIAYGRRNTEIADILSVSEGTVKTHVHRILQKMGVEDRTQAAVIAIRQGIVR